MSRATRDYCLPTELLTTCYIWGELRSVVNVFVVFVGATGGSPFPLTGPPLGETSRWKFGPESSEFSQVLGIIRPTEGDRRSPLLLHRATILADTIIRGSFRTPVPTVHARQRWLPNPPSFSRLFSRIPIVVTEFTEKTVQFFFSVSSVALW